MKTALIVLGSSYVVGALGLAWVMSDQAVFTGSGSPVLLTQLVTNPSVVISLAVGAATLWLAGRIKIPNKPRS